jgi:hypothetical protein
MRYYIIIIIIILKISKTEKIINKNFGADVSKGWLKQGGGANVGKYTPPVTVLFNYIENSDTCWKDLLITKCVLYFPLQFRHGTFFFLLQ